MKFFIHLPFICFALLCAAAGAAADDPLPLPADAPLAPPKAGEITAFANDVKLPRDFKGVAVNVDKEKVMEFLANGELKPAGKDRAHWRTLADFTLPDAIAANPVLLAAKKESAQMPNGQVYFDAFIHTGGVVATGAGAIYFWHLWNDRVLEVNDEMGRACLLVLGPGVKPGAGYMHPYGEFDGAKEPEKKLYGKLETPLAMNIAAFSNRPGSSGEGRRNFLSRERMDAYLAACTVSSRYTPQLCRFDGTLNPFTSGTDANYRKNGIDPNFYQRMEGTGSEDVICDGVLLMRDARIVFWRMGADGAFYFMDDHHRTTCVTTNGGGDCQKRVNSAFVGCNMGGSPKVSLLTYNELTGGNDWPSYQPAPLPGEKAVRSAWEKLAQTADARDPGAWRVLSVTATRFTSYNMVKWYFTVYFVKQDAPDAPVPVLVAMDGTAGGIYRPEEAANKINESGNQFNAVMQKRLLQQWGKNVMVEGLRD